MRWWDLRTRTITRKLSFDNPITSMELSLQTQRLVVTSGRIVAFIPAQPASSVEHHHTLNLPYAPSSASVHPIWKDRFVTGSTSDEWVRVHGMEGEEWEVLKGHHGPVHCVEFSPDGEIYASGSGACKRDHVGYSRLTDDFISLVTSLSIRGWYVVAYCVLRSCSLLPTQAPSDCGRPHQGRDTGFGKVPPTEARDIPSYRGRLISVAAHRLLSLFLKYMIVIRLLMNHRQLRDGTVPSRSPSHCRMQFGSFDILEKTRSPFTLPVLCT